MRGVVRPVVAGDVGAVEVVVAVDVDVDAPVPPVHAAPDRGTGQNAGPKSEYAGTHIARRIPVERFIGRIRPRAVDNAWVIDRHVVFIGTCRLDDIGLRRCTAGRSCRPGGACDLLLRCRLQVAGSVRTRAQPLHGVEYIVLLREERVAEVLCPVELVVHHRQRLWNRRERLDARIPLLLLHRVLERLTGDLGVLARPARRLDHLQRIGRRHQDLRQQIVRIECDRRHQLLDLCRRQRFCSTLLLRPHRRSDEQRRKECDEADNSG